MNADSLRVPRPSSPTGSDSSASSFKSDTSRKRVTPEDETDATTKLDKNKFPRRDTRSTLALNAILEELQQIKAGQARQFELLEELPAMRTAIQSVVADVNALKTETARLSGKTDALTAQTSQISTECDKVVTKVESIEARVTRLEESGRAGPSTSAEILRLSAAANATALHLQRTPSNSAHDSEIVISGFTFGQPTEDCLLQLASAVASAIKVATRTGDFTAARLLRKREAQDTTTQAAAATLPSIPTKSSFAVVCKNSLIASRMISAKRKFGNLKFSQLDAGSLVGDTGFVLPNGDPVFNVNQIFPSKVFKLLILAKDALKKAGFKYVWGRNCTVLAKFRDGDLEHIINSEADIPRLTELYNANNANKQ